LKLATVKKMLASGVLSLAALVISLRELGAAASTEKPSGKPHPLPRHVVVMVWDGMRPDFVTAENTPALYALSRRGVTFAHHHSVYPSATEVNGTALSTGAYPVHSGIMANTEYRPDLDPLKPVHTEALAVVRRGDELTRGRYIHLPTVAELVRQSGRRAVVAGAKPIALLADRADKKSGDGEGMLFAGMTLPPELRAQLTNHYGEFPKELATGPTRIDWTTDALMDPFWAKEIPAFTLLWLNEPDFNQHQTGPGSSQSLAAMRNADENLAKILRVLASKGALETTDVIIVSDHGCSTLSAAADLVAGLNAAGIKAVREFQKKPEPGEILVVSNSGSSLVYVLGHDQELIQTIVKFLQGWEFTGVIFTRKPLPGTFALDQIRVATPEAPDVVISMRWTPEKSKNGTQGMLPGDRSTYSPGQGLHVSLSPFDMHATLVAAGPDFRSAIVDTLPTGNVDVAPTVLWLLGIKPPKTMDGRILTEALTINGPPLKSYQPHHIETTHEQGNSVWHQYLNFTELNGVIYLDEGNGWQTPK
jgi:predicted AlkP superfamily pyrophosphatase or phosphodiesterase